MFDLSSVGVYQIAEFVDRRLAAGFQKRKATATVTAIRGERHRWGLTSVVFLITTAALVAQAPTAESEKTTTPSSGRVARLLDDGKFQMVLDLARKGSLSTTERLLAAVYLNVWTPAETIAPPSQNDPQASDYWYARGIVAARAAWPGGRATELAEAKRAATQLEPLVGPTRAGKRADLRRTSILAAIAAAQEERDELTLLLTHATFLDDQLRGAGAPDDDLMPLDELTGDLWLQVDRYEDARRAYGQAILRRPERTRAWIGLARAARDTGRMDEARTAARTVLDAWTEADDMPVLHELKAIVTP